MSLIFHMAWETRREDEVACTYKGWIEVQGIELEACARRGPQPVEELLWHTLLVCMSRLFVERGIE